MAEPEFSAVGQTHRDTSIAKDAPSVTKTNPDLLVEGPFGGTGGELFYDGVGEVVHITITYSNEVVRSVQVNYRQKTKVVFNAEQHGSRGPKSDEIKLDGDRLLQVKGTTAPAGGGRTAVVTSLTFITTNHTYGPYGATGAKTGKPFESSPHGQVVGFFGRCENHIPGHINAIGIFTDFSSPNPRIKLGRPSGGHGGSPFFETPADKIEQIAVEYDNNAIISVKTTYDGGSQGIVPIKHGGDGSSDGIGEQIRFEVDEYLAQVKGFTHVTKSGKRLVKSLTFITNKHHHGPFGHESGDPFQTRPHDAQIWGFYGRSGSALNQLGAFVGAPSVVKVPHYGGNGGHPFYEGRGKISEIVVTCLEGHYVSKLQFTYLQGDQKFVGHTHGKDEGDTVAPIKLTLDPSDPDADEYLKQVTGSFSHPYPHEAETEEKFGEGILLSISFITNKRTYGPFGNLKAETNFASPDTGVHIVGLFGRSHKFINQIGVICFPDVYF